MGRRFRGASVVEYVVVIGALVLAVLGGFKYFSSSVQTAAKCMGEEVVTGKGCGPKNVDVKADVKAPMQTLSTGPVAMACGPMGCRPGSGNCFVPGTLVSTEHGLEAIEDVVVGEKVWAEDDGRRALKPVTRVFVREDRPIVRVEIEGPAGRESIRATEEHPFFVDGRGFVNANELAPGDRLSSGAVVAAVESTNRLSRVHNFEVEDFHTYFVGRSEVLVHNQCANPRLAPDVPAFAPLGTGGGGWNAMGPVIQDLWKSMASMRGHGVTPSDSTAVPYDYTAGWGAIRSDFYGVEVTLPPNVTPEQFLFRMQNDPHGVTGNSESFGWWVSWDAPQTSRPVGQVVDLQIRGDAGGVMYISTVNGRPGGANTFTVMTVSNSNSGSHPVSGYRTWGITPVPGTNRHVIWTAGIDSANMIGGGPPGSMLQEMTWNAYISGVARNIERSGGRFDGNVHNVTVKQPGTVTPTNTAPLTAPTAINTWRPNAAQERADAEIRRYANSCTSDRRNCSGEIGRYARELIENDERRARGLPPRDPFPGLGDFMRPRGAPQNAQDRARLLEELLRQPAPIDRVGPQVADFEVRIVQSRPNFYQQHQAAPGSCRNCH